MLQKRKKKLSSKQEGNTKVANATNANTTGKGDIQTLFDIAL